MLGVGWSQKTVLKGWEVTLGLKGIHMHGTGMCGNGQNVRPAKWTFMSNGGHQRAGSGDSASTN